MKQHSARLLESNLLTPTVMKLVFEITSEDDFSYIPGQFVSFQLPSDGEKPLKRSYSIASLAADTKQAKQFEIVIAHVEDGRATQIFFNAQPGEEFHFTGPFGQLVLPPELPKRLFLIGTGTGVAPYRTMLPELQKRNANGEMDVHLMFGVRKRGDGFYLEDFLDARNTINNFNFHYCLSREDSFDEVLCESCGYVQQQLLNLQPNPETDLVYLCGNPYMVDAVFELLKEKEFPIKQVRREKYVFSKF